MPEMRSTYLGELRITVAQSCLLGEAPHGRRRIDSLGAGQFKGPRINADLLPGGMDIHFGGRDGPMRLDMRFTLKPDDGEFLLIQYRGARHGSPEVMQRIASGENVPLQIQRPSITISRPGSPRVASSSKPCRV